MSRIIRVKGEAGAKALPLKDGDCILAVDTTAPIIWFVIGSRDQDNLCLPYDITPHKDINRVAT